MIIIGYKVIDVKEWIENDDLLERKDYILTKKGEINVKADSCNCWKAECTENQHSLIT